MVDCVQSNTYRLFLKSKCHQFEICAHPPSRLSVNKMFWILYTRIYFDEILWMNQTSWNAFWASSAMNYIVIKNKFEISWTNKKIFVECRSRMTHALCNCAATWCRNIHIINEMIQPLLREDLSVTYQYWTRHTKPLLGDLENYIITSLHHYKFTSLHYYIIIA